MLYSQGAERSAAADRRLAASLAFVAGAMNAAGFRAVGFFSGNMTGNVTSAADKFASGDLVVSLAYLVIVAAFVLGAACSTMLTEVGKRRGARGVHAWSVACEALLLGSLGVCDLYVPGVHGGPVFVLWLSFLMGVQNATVTRISGARVRTTHVSGMLTDIGIECAELAAGPHPSAPRSDEGDPKANLALHAQTVLSFLVGGAVGVFLYLRIGGFLFVMAGALLLCLSLPSLARARADAGSAA